MKYDFKKYRDGQVSSTITEKGALHVKIRGNSYEDLFAAASVKEAWDEVHCLDKSVTATLTIYCLIGQRSDRRFSSNDSFDLKIIARFINSMRFDRVFILHPHSSVSLALINNSQALSPFNYVKQAFDALVKPLIVSPDAGAYKNNHSIAKMLETDMVAANKVRINGEPHVQIMDDVAKKECLIVDDIADGGRTFVPLAESLKNQGAAKVFLYVTHGMFHFGFQDLKEHIDHIYCTNSYKDIDNDYVTQIGLF